MKSKHEIPLVKNHFGIRIAFLLLGCSFFGGLNSFGNEECNPGLQKLGSYFNPQKQRIEFSVYSENATRMEVHLYADPEHSAPRGNYLLQKDGDTNIWHTASLVPDLINMNLIDPDIHAHNPTELVRPIYYGYRVWGPNFTYEPGWHPGSLEGFHLDVDLHGNRFNPNKLLTDPMALELSHDNITFRNPTDSIFSTGPEFRHLDSGPVAPKGIVMNPNIRSAVAGPSFPKRKNIVYETHVRGFTMDDPSIPPDERGTFKGAARKIGYLKDLGINTVEFLPVHEFQDDANREDDTTGNNYWGYMTDNFFAPNRRYATAASRSKLGGVTEEFRDMVDAFHRAGIKVIIDVVYNHTGESGAGGPNGEYSQLHSFRGMDNSTYYQTAADARFYKDNTGCGANFNCAHPQVRNLVMDSLKYYRQLGVDGFRFDLASVLMNGHTKGNEFWWHATDPNNVFNRAIRELPVRKDEGGEGVDIYAEPWAVDDYEQTYQLGNFPNHPESQRSIAAWNGKYRDTIRRAMNGHGINHPTMRELADALSGSPELYNNRNRGPDASLNFVVSHDGFSLNDLVSFNRKRNDRPAPFGPSNGGEDNNHSWDQAEPGDSIEKVAAKQRQAVRNGLTFLMLSQGSPMITGGDETFRSTGGNNNTYNLDTPENWQKWKNYTHEQQNHFQFNRNIIAFRTAHPSLSPSQFYKEEDTNGNGLREISWHKPDGNYSDDGYLNDRYNAFLGCRIDAEKQGESVRSIYYAVNMSPNAIDIHIPAPKEGKQWYWVGDTHETYEQEGNLKPLGSEMPLSWKRGASTADYRIGARSILTLVEK